MRKKDKRRLLKNFDPPNPKPTQTFTLKEMEVIAQEHAHKVLTNYLAATLMVLRYELKYSKKRMTTFMEKESEYAKLISSKRMTAEDIFNQIESETGFSLDEFIKERAEG